MATLILAILIATLKSSTRSNWKIHKQANQWAIWTSWKFTGYFWQNQQWAGYVFRTDTKPWKPRVRNKHQWMGGNGTAQMEMMTKRRKFIHMRSLFLKETSEMNENFPLCKNWAVLYVQSFTRCTQIT